MKLEKYEGLGNTFLITNEYKDNLKELSIKLCDNDLGIGADGLIYIDTYTKTIEIYNKDGSIAPMCGNGIRCVSYYLFKHNYINSKIFDINTLDNKKRIEILNYKPFIVNVEMGTPSFSKEKVKVNINEPIIKKELIINNKKYIITTIYLTTIHTVIVVNNLNEVDYTEGELISNHPLFLEKTNVNFIEIIDKNTIKQKTYERGVGWTKACGSGACASSYVLNKYYNLKNKIKVIMEYGELDIEIKDKVYMIGVSKKIGDIIIEEEYINA